MGNLSEGNYSNCSLEAFDLAGNASGSKPITSFTVDRTVPDNLSLVLNGGDNQTVMENITIALGGNDTNGISQYCVQRTSNTSVPSDNDSCWIVADNSTSFNTSFSNFALGSNYEMKTVKAWFKDRAGNTNDINSSINKVDPNQAPVFGNGNAQNFTLLENPVIGSTIATIGVSDPDNDNYTLTLSGADQAQFSISQSGLVTVATGAQIDYESKSQLSFEITATENRNDNRTVLHSSASITINVQDLPETSGEYALRFDGIDDKVSVTSNHSLQNDNITIVAWIKPDELTNDYHTIVGFKESFNLKLQNHNGDYKISVHIKTDIGGWTSDVAITT
ncbi:MAG: calsyntenin family protein, partial [Candidatus Neomarinimicrobiota bacterium]|nr:calsyntenin family protein [Candidatus Neomarinimicrobiota bacterium]